MSFARALDRLKNGDDLLIPGGSMALRTDLGKAKKLIEAVLKSTGVNPDENRVTAVEGGTAWAIARGSAALMIALNPGRTDEPSHVRMISPIVKIYNDRKLELFERLLELNATALIGTAFGIAGQEIVLVSERSVRNLDKSEVEEMLAAIGYFADQYDDLLVEEFGGIRVCDLD